MKRYRYGTAVLWVLLGLFVVPHLYVGLTAGPRLGGVTVAAAQEPDDAGVPGSAPRVSTVWDMVKVGGLIMIPIGLCSVWMLALLVELFLKLREKTACPPEVVQQLQGCIEAEDYLAAWQVSRETPSILSHVMRRALKKLPKGHDAVDEEAAEALMDENNLYKTKISYLGVVAAVSPMLGLLGTVSGMIKAFNKMGHEGAIGDPAKLAGDIGEALVTTFTGLVVAIPAMIVFYVMTNRSKKVLTRVQECFTGLMENVPYHQIPEDLVFESEAAPADVSPAVAASPVAAAPAPAPKPRPKARVAAAATIPCPSCNEPVAEGAARCPKCGQELDWT